MSLRKILVEANIRGYWGNLAKIYGTSIDVVERTWRETEVELFKSGINPKDETFMSKIILKVKEKLEK